MKKPFTIGIDGNEANVSQRVGSNVYAYQLLVAMERFWQTSNDVEVVVFLSSPPQADLPSVREGWRYEVVAHAPLWNLWRLPWELRNWSQKLDLFFSPGHYLPSWLPVPAVCTVMDLAYEHYPGFFKTRDLWQLQLFTRSAVKKSQHVFAISKATKSDLIEHYGCSKDKVTVAYPGSFKVKPLPSKEVKSQLQFLEVNQPYLLFIGTLQPRKNIVRLVKVFEKLKKQGYTGELIIAGKVGWKAAPIMTAIKSSTVYQHIKYLGFVDHQQKKALIQGADLLVLPGLYEGFGLPPLEALQLGTLPVVSKTASLPEVINQPALQFDPLSVADMQTVIDKALHLAAPRQKKMINDLKQHSKQFDWDQTAALVCQQLVSLLK